MLSEFEDYFGSVDLDDFRAFIKEAKVENQRMRSQEGFGEGEAESVEVINFMMALLENIEDEIQGVTDLSNLNFKKKVRLYSMIHLFHYICDDMDEDDDFDYDDEYEDDEDEEASHESDWDPDGNNDRIVRL